MRIVKIPRGDGKISINCQYPYDEYPNGGTAKILEQDIQTTCKIIFKNGLDSTIHRGEMVTTSGSRGRKLKKPRYIGRCFAFVCDEVLSDLFTETTFVLMR